MLSCEYCKIFKNTYFEEHLQMAASVLLIIKVLIKYWTTADLFLFKTITWNGFYYKGLYVCSEYIFCWFLVETIPTRKNIVLISGFWQIYAGCCPLHNVYFNDMQTNRWQNFKDIGHLFTVNLPMAATKIHNIFLEHFFISLDKSVWLHQRCLMSKFHRILILLCRKIFSFFLQIFHETFSNSCGFALI